MFDNPGQKLKTVSKVLFILSLIGTIFLALAVSIVEEEVGYYYTYTETVFHAERFLAVLLVLPLGSYVQCLFLFGFGALIENSENANLVKSKSYLIEDIERNLPQL